MEQLGYDGSHTCRRVKVIIWNMCKLSEYLIYNNNNNNNGFNLHSD